MAGNASFSYSRYLPGVDGINDAEVVVTLVGRDQHRLHRGFRNRKSSAHHYAGDSESAFIHGGRIISIRTGEISYCLTWLTNHP